jgi:hypothetical protein
MQSLLEKEEKILNKFFRSNLLNITCAQDNPRKREPKRIWDDHDKYIKYEKKIKQSSKAVKQYDFPFLFFNKPKENQRGYKIKDKRKKTAIIYWGDILIAITL